MTSNALTLHTVNEEQLVLDTDLAERLGYSKPTDIRKLIYRKDSELRRYGIIATVAQNTGQRGRRATASFLNEEQALLICMFADTDNAANVRKLAIDTFMAVRRGQQPITVLSIPNIANPEEAARAWAVLLE